MRYSLAYMVVRWLYCRPKFKSWLGTQWKFRPLRPQLGRYGALCFHDLFILCQVQREEHSLFLSPVVLLINETSERVQAEK
jgi:hypothetical protein